MKPLTDLEPGARRHPSDPEAWLARAQSNLRIAELGSAQPGVFLEDLCFEAQQAAEKGLKAVCVSHGVDVPRTRSLVIMVDTLEQEGLQIPPEVKDAAGLTAYAVQAWYPDWGEAVTVAEYA
jgi:HEPN domain-containing protein